ncbi:MAG: glycoside hydrolase family 3 C-terminal domain-containing protein [Bacteroidota bacterium]
MIPKNYIYALLFVLLGTTTNVFSQIISIEQKVDTLVSKMTLDEKINQLCPYDVMNTADNPRLWIPGFYTADGPHGYRDPDATGYPAPTEALATSFPISMAVAATWDTNVAYRMARTMGLEFQSKGINMRLAPSLYLCNDPRNGRSAESYGEDPYLCSKIGVATVKGLQSTPGMSSIKSFICENAQATRMTDTITISKRMIMEHWGLPFKNCIQKSNALTAMGAYVAVNGIAASHSFDLNTTILREKWGFPYLLVSDWGSVHNAKEAIHSGTDICMGSSHYSNDLKTGVNNGTIPLSDVNKAVKNVIRTKLVAGLLDFQPSAPDDALSGQESQAIDYETGLKSLVLLKNQNNILPLNKNTINSIALIGPNANDGCLNINGSSFVFPTGIVTVKNALEQEIGYWKVNYQKGCAINSWDTTGFADAIYKAATSDVVVFVGGLDVFQEGETYDRVGGSVELPGLQQILINYLASVNPNIIVILESGSIVSLSQCLHNIKGLVYGFYPGQEQGRAIVDVLLGDYNPGGKLPVSMPINDSQIPVSNTNFNDDWGGGYFWLDKQNYTPAFAFGHGLSYTTFAYNSIQTASSTINAGDKITVSVSVTNTGSKAGDEVVQLYVSHPTTSLPMPTKQLKAFNRVHFLAGETKIIKFELKPEDLYVFDESIDNYTLLTGTYLIKVGGASNNLPLNTSIVVNPASPKPDLSAPTIVCYPPYPKVGDTVVFALNVKNQGTGIFNGNLKAEIIIDNQTIAVIDTTITIGIGGMRQINANKGIANKNWWIPQVMGDYAISATLDQNQLISETDENNNLSIQNLKVYGEETEQLKINLAYKKPATASSFSSNDFFPNYANDGLRNSRWISNTTNNEYYQVDLLDEYNLKSIIIKWENAYASHYQLLTSKDLIDWDTVAMISFGNGKKDDFATDINARYIKVICTQGGTPFGYSICELEAYGFPVSITDISKISSSSSFNVFPNPFNDQITLTYFSEESSDAKLNLFDAQGRKVWESALISLNQGNNQLNFSLNDITSGIYYLRFESQFENKFMKLIKP